MTTRKTTVVFAVVAGAALMAAALPTMLGQRDNLFALGGKQSMVALGGLALLLGGIIGLLPQALRRIGQWALLTVAALAVVMAADLLTNRSAHEWSMAPLLVRFLMLALVGAALHVGGMTAADPSGRWGMLTLLGATAQIGLLTLLMHEYQIESPLVQHNIMLLACFGFFLHHLLALSHRLSFFLLLSLICLLCIFGLSSGLWLIGIGLCLIGLCHLPAPFGVRVVLLLLAGGGLALLRVDRWVHAPFSSAVWPILGSLFMFRLIIYLYDLKHQKKEKVKTAQSLSYFFLFPNLAFPLFPVVDWTTFKRTYYDQEAHSIYRTGIAWMYLGVLHLLCYRLVNYHLVMAPSDVTSVPELVRYLAANFLLYLRLSGQFHLIVGMLHLFGFNLPVTHHLYFLSSSFTDFWRRINIYWKDFMLKVFYMPCYFALRKRGGDFALVVSTLIVFFITWFSHAYQWFWLRGTFLLSVTDMLFWGLLAALVVVNALWESKRGRERAIGPRSWSVGEMAPIVLRTVGTFGVICVLWSLWTAESVSEWLALWSGAGLRLDGVGALVPLALLGLVVGGETWRIRRMARASAVPAVSAPSPSQAGGHRFRWAGVGSVGVMLLLLFVGNPNVYGKLPDRPQEVIRDLTGARLSFRDEALLQRGYYEDLIGVDRFNSELWELYSKRPAGWQGLQTLLPDSGDFLKTRLPPNTTLYYMSKNLRTNRWGMRDRDYAREKPAKTYRIALLGSSHVMGSGVENHEIFETLLEDRLNREPRNGPYERIEILNFAVAGHSPIQMLHVLETQALDFQPDAVLFFASPHDLDWSLGHIENRVRKGIANPYEFAQEIERKAGVTKDTPEAEAERRLKPYRAELLAWIYRRVKEVCEGRGIAPLWIFLPFVQERSKFAKAEELIPLAQQAGLPIVDMTDVYEGYDRKSLYVAEWDYHPNAQGHRLIAERLHQVLREQGDRIPLGLTARAQEGPRAALEPARQTEPVATGDE